MTCEEAEAVTLGRRNGAASTREVEGTEEEDGLEERRGEQGKAPMRTRERCRQAARRLAARGEVVVMQKGKVVDPSFAKGVMDLRLPPS